MFLVLWLKIQEIVGFGFWVLQESGSCDLLGFRVMWGLGFRGYTGDVRGLYRNHEKEK